MGKKSNRVGKKIKRALGALGIARAIKAAGSQAALAKATGVTQQTVSLWLAQGFVPEGRVVEVEMAVLGAPPGVML